MTIVDDLQVPGLRDTILTDLQTNLVGAGTTVAEVAVLHGVTPGTAKASSGLVLGSGFSATGLRKPVLTKTATYPLTVADSGSVVITNPSGADIVVTLPAPAAGLEYTIKNKGTSSATGLDIKTNGSGEKVYATGVTAAAGKGLINTHATESPGDECRIVSDGTDWFAVVAGTWAREA